MNYLQPAKRLASLLLISQVIALVGCGSDGTPSALSPKNEATPVAVEWDTLTGAVSAFNVDSEAGVARRIPLERTLQDASWELQATGDLNGDAQADVILRNAEVGQNLVWFINPDGQGILSEEMVGRDLPDPNWRISGTGDFNGDGNVDLVLSNPAADQILAWYMDGKGGIESEAPIGRSLGDSDWKIEAIADFNGDGNPDILLRHALNGQTLLWEMEGSTILAESPIGRDLADVSWQIEGARDFDDNGTVDLFLRHPETQQGLLLSMEDKTTIASEQPIAEVPPGTSQLVF